MTGQKRKHYPVNWETLARICKERAGWKCEHCQVAQFTIRTSKRNRPYIVYLHAAYEQHDKDNPEPELLCLCISCHGRLDHEHRQRVRRTELERMKHQKLLAGRVDLRFYGG